MNHYVAYIRKETGSDYGVEFPDVPGCITAGRTLDEARAMAAEALAGHLETLEAPKDDPHQAGAILVEAAEAKLG